MGVYGDDARARAKELAEAAEQLLRSTNFGADPKIQALFVVGKVQADFLAEIANLADYLAATEELTEQQKKAREAEERNSAIRNAAAAATASGDWSRFDTLVGQFTGEGGASD